jgi:hypothetical protein
MLSKNYTHWLKKIECKVYWRQDSKLERTRQQTARQTHKLLRLRRGLAKCPSGHFAKPRLSRNSPAARLTHGGKCPPTIPPSGCLVVWATPSWFLLTNRTLQGLRGAFSPPLPCKPTHAKNHAGRHSAKSQQGRMFSDWGLHPQTPEPQIAHAMPRTSQPHNQWASHDQFEG